LLKKEQKISNIEIINTKLFHFISDYVTDDSETYEAALIGPIFGDGIGFETGMTQLVIFLDGLG